LYEIIEVMGYSDLIPVFLFLNLLVSIGGIKALLSMTKVMKDVADLCGKNIETSNETRDHLYKVTYGKATKLYHICSIVEKDEAGEWGYSNRFVRVGSSEYMDALATPGIALRHRGGQVEEGNQC
jgi:hypothetical protein